VNRYDIHGKRIFETNDKFYFEDNGIRNAIAGGTREGDIEKVIENIIYQNLQVVKRSLKAQKRSRHFS
jgi:predicted AAA+ superfamily ATPase